MIAAGKAAIGALLIVLAVVLMVAVTIITAGRL